MSPGADTAADDPFLVAMGEPAYTKLTGADPKRGEPQLSKSTEAPASRTQNPHSATLPVRQRVGTVFSRNTTSKTGS